MSYKVVDYQTGETVVGAADPGLVAASLAAGPTGAVGAQQSTDGTWHYLSEADYDSARARYGSALGKRLRVVYVDVGK